MKKHKLPLVCFSKDADTRNLYRHTFSLTACTEHPFPWIRRKSILFFSHFCILTKTEQQQLFCPKHLTVTIQPCLYMHFSVLYNWFVKELYQKCTAPHPFPPYCTRTITLCLESQSLLYVCIRCPCLISTGHKFTKTEDEKVLKIYSVWSLVHYKQQYSFGLLFFFCYIVLGLRM